MKLNIDLSSDSDRGQVGIETLVVFIAMILVAALAAGVLINTAGFLQNKASATSEDSQAQVSNQVRIIGAVGHVETGGDTSTENNITSIDLSVMQAPGAEEIDLEGATIRYISPNGATTLVYNESGGNPYKWSGNANNATFGVTGVKDPDGSAPVLNSQEDRFRLSIDLANDSYNSSTGSPDPGVGVVEALTALKPGEEATLRVVTMSGAQSTYIVNVPQSLSSADDGQAVSL